MIPAKYWSPTKKLMLLGAMAGGKAIEDTATGNPVTFLTDLARPLKSLLIPFAPKQEGTGDPSPQNVRSILPWNGLTVEHGGKNLFDKGHETVYRVSISNGAIGGSSKAVTFILPCKANTTYTVSKVATARSVIAYSEKTELPENGDTVKGSVYFQNQTSATITTGNDAKWLVIYANNGNYDSTPEQTVIDSIQLEVGEAATTYESYKPITEHSVVFPAMGKNLVTGTNYGGEFYNVGSGTDLAKSGTYVSYEEDGNTIEVTTEKVWQSAIFATGLLPPGTYNIHYESESPNLKISSYVTDKDLVTIQRNSVVSNNTTVTLAETARIAVVIGSSQIETVTVQNLQVEAGSSYTSWEAFDNTIFGGYVDLVTGELWKTHIKAVVTDAVRQIRFAGSYRCGCYINDVIPSYPKPVAVDSADVNPFVACDAFKSDSINKVNSGTVGIAINSSGDSFWWCYGEINPTEEQVRDKLAEHPLTITYKLLNPVYIATLTPQEITALVGNNTLWSDADGQLTAVYFKKG